MSGFKTVQEVAMMIWPLTDCEECLRQSGGYIYVDDAAIHAKGSQNEE